MRGFCAGGFRPAARRRRGAAQLGNQIRQVVELLQVRDPHQRHFDQRAGLRAVAQPRERVVENLHDRQDGFGAQLLATRGQSLVLPSRRVQKRLARAADDGHQRVAKMAQQLFEQLSGFDAFGQRGVQFGDGSARVVAYQMIHQRCHPRIVGRAEHGVDAGRRDLLGAESEQLFQQRLAVAHRAGGASGQNRQGLGLDVGAFGLDDLPESLDDRLLPDAREVEALAAREDRDRNLRRLGGAEDELHVLGRLFQRFQKRVERLAREHVDFVDDVDLAAGPAGANADVLTQLTDLVDAPVAGPVDLQHVDVAAGADALAHVAAVAGRGRGALFAIECLGQDPRCRGLADAPSAGEQIGMADPIRGDRARERSGDVLLTDQLIERLWPVAAGNDDVLAARRFGAYGLQRQGWLGRLLFRFSHRRLL